MRLTLEARRALEHSIDYARTGGQTSIGPEHLLLGLLAMQTGTAAEFLRQRGIDLNALRADIDPAQPGLLSAVTAGTQNNVVMCRLEDRALEAIDMLIEAGVRANRSEAAAWLINVGLESKAAVLDVVKDNVAEIHRLREAACALAEEAGADR